MVAYIDFSRVAQCWHAGNVNCGSPVISAALKVPSQSSCLGYESGAEPKCGAPLETLRCLSGPSPPPAPLNHKWATGGLGADKMNTDSTKQGFEPPRFSLVCA